MRTFQNGQPVYGCWHQQAAVLLKDCETGSSELAISVTAVQCHRAYILPTVYTVTTHNPVTLQRTCIIHKEALALYLCDTVLDGEDSVLPDN